MTRLFLGGLKEGASRTELEREFGAFGQLREVWVARKPPGFGFILFEDSRDADAALKEMNGQFICGGRIRVEYARDSGGGRGGGGGGGGDRKKSYGGGGYGDSYNDRGGDYRGGGDRGGNYRGDRGGGGGGDFRGGGGGDYRGGRGGDRGYSPPRRSDRDRRSSPLPQRRRSPRSRSRSPR